MTTETRHQVFQIPDTAIEEVQRATIAANAAIFDAWTRVVRSQQQLAEAGIKFWLATFTSQLAR